MEREFDVCRGVHRDPAGEAAKLRSLAERWNSKEVAVEPLQDCTMQMKWKISKRGTAKVGMRLIGNTVIALEGSQVPSQSSQ